MSDIYITDEGADLHLRNNELIINLIEQAETDQDGVELQPKSKKCKTCNRTITNHTLFDKFPIEMVDSISIFGRCNLSSHLMQYILENEIPVFFHRKTGNYIGKLSGNTWIDPKRQKKQALCSMNQSFKTVISKITVREKLKNSVALLTAHNIDNSVKINNSIEQIQMQIKNVQVANNVDMIRGFEGTAARIYFQAVSSLLPVEFRFQRRSQQPPLDPFNAMLSLGYSQLYGNAVGLIENYGLNPCHAFLHEDSHGHNSLASDLMEEWRSLIVDDSCIMLAKSGIFNLEEDFRNIEDRNKHSGVYMHKTGSRKLFPIISNKMAQAENYLGIENYKTSFKYAFEAQVQRLCRAIDENEPWLFDAANDSRVIKSDSAQEIVKEYGI